MSTDPDLQGCSTIGGSRIFRLPLQAFPGFWVWAYLVQTGDRLTLIDCGSGLDASNAGLEAGVKQAGFELGDLTHILLTHGHIDHYGGLPFLRERTQALVGAHELDWGTLCQHESRLALMSHKLETYLTTTGIGPAQRGDLLDMYRLTKSHYRSVPVDIGYEASDMQVGPFELLHLPGHCPGHVAIRLDEVVFCGDVLLENVTPHQSPGELTPFVGVRHFLHSLCALERWASDAQVILNGHDEAFQDLSVPVARVRRNLALRIRQTLAALAEPCTIASATQQVYGDLDGYTALLVIEKVGAYIEYLYQRGLVEITNAVELSQGGQPVALQYHSVRDVSETEIIPKERAYVFV